jgi:hypothetical protein
VPGSQPQTTKKGLTDRLTPEAASAEDEKVESEKKPQQKREISDEEGFRTDMGSIGHEIPREAMRTNELVFKKRQPLRRERKRDNRARPSRDKCYKCKDLYKNVCQLPPHGYTSAASTDRPKPVLSPAVKVVSDDWDDQGSTDESEDSDDSEALVNSWHSPDDKDTSDAPEDDGSLGY